MQQDGVVVRDPLPHSIGDASAYGPEPLRPAHARPVAFLQGQQLRSHQDSEAPGTLADRVGVLGAADRVDGLIHQGPPLAARPSGPADRDEQINRAGVEVPVGVGGDTAHVDLGVGRLEPCQEWHEPAAGRRRGDRDGHHLGGPVVQVLDVADGLVYTG